MSRGRSPRNVVDLVDAQAAVALGGLAYATRSAELEDGPPAALELGLGDERAGRVRIAIDRVALDRRGIVATPRPYPPPPGAVVLDDAAARDSRLNVWPTTDDGLTRWREFVEDLHGGRRVVIAMSGVDRFSVAQIAVHLIGSGFTVSFRDQDHPALGLLAPDLVDEITSERAASEDALEWAASLARQSRSVWRDHMLRLTWQAGGPRAPRLEPIPLPRISVILVSRRPELVDAALARIAAQVGVDAEVIVGLHHAGNELDSVEASLDRHGLDGEALAVDPSVPFGAVLNLAVERSSGLVITKWDDDDLYGSSHLMDVLLGLRSSQAHLVGKAPEFIYFEARHETVLRNPGGAGTSSTVLAGGTLATPRVVFDDVGGFAPIPRAVDHHLKQWYLERGLRLHRTHGFGFALTRRGNEHHTWPTDENELWQSGVRRWSGIPAIAALGEAHGG